MIRHRFEGYSHILGCSRIGVNRPTEAQLSIGLPPRLQRRLRFRGQLLLTVLVSA